MTIDQLRAVHKAQPFLPFTLKMADGNTLTVTHPEWLSNSATGRTVVLVRPDDSFAIVDLLLVASIEVCNGQAAKHPSQPRPG